MINLHAIPEDGEKWQHVQKKNWNSILCIVFDQLKKENVKAS